MIEYPGWCWNALDRLCKDAVGRLGISMLFFFVYFTLRLVRERRGWWSAGAMRLMYWFVSELPVQVYSVLCIGEGSLGGLV